MDDLGDDVDDDEVVEEDPHGLETARAVAFLTRDLPKQHQEVVVEECGGDFVGEQQHLVGLADFVEEQVDNHE